MQADRAACADTLSPATYILAVSATAFGPGLVKSIKTRLRKVAEPSPTRAANVF